MSPNLITMLTYHDQTTHDAIDIFDECKGLPVDCWGFKNIGLPSRQMKILVRNMKQAGKTTFLEVVTYPEHECLSAAKLAIECSFDYLMGTIFHQSVLDLLRNSQVKYFPFCGKVSGNPSILEGTIPGMIDEAKRLISLGVNGLDLLAFRYRDDCERLAKEFVTKVKAPVVIAGNIDSVARLNLINELQPWGFTIGSAFFEKRFVKSGNFHQQIETVLNYMQHLNTII